MPRHNGDLVPSGIIGHFINIPRERLDDPLFRRFLRQRVETRRGIYALYNEDGGLYYVGRATKLPKRIKRHGTDKHKDNWQTMSLFFVAGDVNVGELEGILIAIAKPPGNERQPRLGRDLARQWARFLRTGERN